jgi:hypothetical protein
MRWGALGLLVPVLMLADYYLTLAGAVLQKRRHAEHFEQQSYELNPVWQRSVAQRRWFNPRHLFLVVLVTCLVVFLLESGDVPDDAAQCLIAGLFVAQGMVVGRHLSNLLVFRRMDRYPDEVTGRVTMSHSLTLAVSTFQYLVVVVPVAVLAALDPTPTTFGGVAGAIAVLLAHGFWIWRHRRALRRQAAAAAQ